MSYNGFLILGICLVATSSASRTSPAPEDLSSHWRRCKVIVKDNGTESCTAQPQVQDCVAKKLPTVPAIGTHPDNSICHGVYTEDTTSCIQNVDFHVYKHRPTHTGQHEFQGLNVSWTVSTTVAEENDDTQKIFEVRADVPGFGLFGAIVAVNLTDKDYQNDTATINYDCIYPIPIGPDINISATEIVVDQLILSFRPAWRGGKVITSQSTIFDDNGYSIATVMLSGILSAVSVGMCFAVCFIGFHFYRKRINADNMTIMDSVSVSDSPIAAGDHSAKKILIVSTKDNHSLRKFCKRLCEHISSKMPRCLVIDVENLKVTEGLCINDVVVSEILSADSIIVVSSAGLSKILQKGEHRFGLEPLEHKQSIPLLVVSAVQSNLSVSENHKVIIVHPINATVCQLTRLLSLWEPVLIPDDNVKLITFLQGPSLVKRQKYCSTQSGTIGPVHEYTDTEYWNDGLDHPANVTAQQNVFSSQSNHHPEADLPRVAHHSGLFYMPQYQHNLSSNNLTIHVPPKSSDFYSEQLNSGQFISYPGALSDIYSEGMSQAVCDINK